MKSVLINESGLYTAIIGSQLPAAKAFKRWVTSDILPSIRKHGAYITDELLRRIRDGEELTGALFDQLVEEKIQNRTLIGAVGTLAPKARYCDIILQCADAVQTSIVAKDYGQSCVAFNKLLHDMGVQFRIGKTWLLYKAFAGMGYTISKTFYIDGKTASIQTCWTQAGRFWLYDFLKQHGILPDSEKETAVYQTRMDMPN